MVSYICKTCDNLICETSKCPVCGVKTEVYKSDIFWCSKCNCPSYYRICDNCNSDCERISSDIRPVFPEERLLIEILLGVPFKYASSSVWNLSGNYYLVDGKKIKFQFNDIIKYHSIDDTIFKLEANKKQNQQYIDEFSNSEHILNFIKVNKNRLNSITDEAIRYIREVSEKRETSDLFVSFSGGKDSTVTSHLVMNALETKKVIHIYGDTTLEYPTTGEYIKKFKIENSETPVLVAKNKDQEFNNLCEVVGPPSRVMRWCCTVFKTGAITKKIEQSFKEKKTILTFYGIRRSESNSRSKYDRESDSPKITKQKVVSPIIDWFDSDVWLYILSNKISFNDAYKQGFARVGCWCCPNNGPWSEYLSGIYMNSQYNALKDILYKFAKKVGKDDWKEYIDTGKWRARQGGNGLEYSKRAIINFKPCVLEENSYNFDLVRPIDDNLYNLFVPFGRVDYSLGNKRLGEVYIISNHTKKPMLKLSGRTDTFTLKITVIDRVGIFKIPKFTESYLKNQLTKYQTCIACSACQSVCKFNAIRIFNELPGQVSNNTINYCIDANKCVNCLECVTHFDGGCYMKKVLRTKKDYYREEIKS